MLLTKILNRHVSDIYVPPITNQVINNNSLVTDNSPNKCPIMVNLPNNHNNLVNLLNKLTNPNINNNPNNTMMKELKELVTIIIIITLRATNKFPNNLLYKKNTPKKLRDI